MLEDVLYCTKEDLVQRRVSLGYVNNRAALVPQSPAPLEVLQRGHTRCTVKTTVLIERRGRLFVLVRLGVALTVKTTTHSAR